MEFQYNPKHRREVEGWNIIYFDGEDKIGLSSDEYDSIGEDFEMNGMIEYAVRSFERGIALRSPRSMALLGRLYERQGNMEEAYIWYLEAAMGEDDVALRYLSDMYREGNYVRKDEVRAKALALIADENMKSSQTDG